MKNDISTPEKSWSKLVELMRKKVINLTILTLQFRKHTQEVFFYMQNTNWAFQEFVLLKLKAYSEKGKKSFKNNNRHHFRKNNCMAARSMVWVHLKVRRD